MPVTASPVWPGAKPVESQNTAPRLVGALVRESRPLVAAVWELTLACDQRCRHCGSRAGKARPRELDTDECLEVVAALSRLGTREVTLIGGEAYLRDDFVEIVSAISESGMRCSMQTGGRTLREETMKRAKKAGLAHLGVSVDGSQVAHDVRRGRGSYTAAMKTLHSAHSLGIPTAVNTQVGAEGLAGMDDLLGELSAAQVLTWRIGFVTPLGRAGDRPEILLQPFELLTVMPQLASLSARAKAVGIALQIDNGVGYFGPFESLLRSLGHEQIQWSGCNAGTLNLGIESDGTVKACPSLPTQSYAAGNVRNLQLHEIWNSSSDMTKLGGRKRSDLSGFCASCYYADVCAAGCNYTAHALFGKTGDNPYCHHRAIELDRQGLRERVHRLTPGPGLPFDHGQFALVLERADGSSWIGGSPRDETVTRDDGKYRDHRPNEKLDLCRGCSRHIFHGTQICPHCGGDLIALEQSHHANLANLDAAREELTMAIRGLFS